MTNIIYNSQSPNNLLERTGVCTQTGFTASIIMPEISMSLKTLKKRWSISFIKCRNQGGTGEQLESFHFPSAQKEPINGVVKSVSILKSIFIISNYQNIIEVIWYPMHCMLWSILQILLVFSSIYVRLERKNVRISVNKISFKYLI